jgi:hypothetical protein
VGTAGRQKILSQYTWQRVTERVLAIAESILSTRETGR